MTYESLVDRLNEVEDLISEANDHGELSTALCAILNGFLDILTEVHEELEEIDKQLEG